MTKMTDWQTLINALLEEIWIEQMAFPDVVSLGQLPKPKTLKIILKPALDSLIKRYLVYH